MTAQTDALRSWKHLNKVLQGLDEETVRTLLKKERRGKRRQNILRRLHQRLCRLRAVREQGEWLKR